MDKKILNTGLATIWTLVYRSTQVTLDVNQEEQLHTAIKNVANNWDKNDPFIGRSQFVCECARGHLAALRAMPPRKPNRVESLMEDCQKLEHYLDRL